MAKSVVNSDIYNLAGLVNDVKKQFITDADDETLSVGIYGAITAIESKRLQSQAIMTGEECNESFPTRARLERSVITHAVMYNIEDINAAPAHMNIRLGLRRIDIEQYMKDNVFVIDRECPIYVGDYEFHLDYDVIIRKISLKNTDNINDTEMVYTAYYNMPELDDNSASNISSVVRCGRTNKASSITNPYLASPAVVYLQGEAEVSEDGKISTQDEYLFINVLISQVMHHSEPLKLVTSNIIDNKTVTFQFENQLAYFEVHITQGDEEIYLNPYFEGGSLPETETRYCWYQYIDTNKIRVRFDRNSYMPTLNADIEVLYKTTNGAAGNFNYIDTIYANLQSSIYGYKNITMMINSLGKSIGGKNRKSKKELQRLIPKEALARGSYTTITDLNNYFGMLDSEVGRMIVQKKIDNQQERTYYSYLVLKDSNNNVVPTNTIRVSIPYDAMIHTSNAESDNPRHVLRQGAGVMLVDWASKTEPPLGKMIFAGTNVSGSYNEHKIATTLTGLESKNYVVGDKVTITDKNNKNKNDIYQCITAGNATTSKWILLYSDELIPRFNLLYSEVGSTYFDEKINDSDDVRTNNYYRCTVAGGPSEARWTIIYQAIELPDAGNGYHELNEIYVKDNIAYRCIENGKGTDAKWAYAYTEETLPETKNVIGSYIDDKWVEGTVTKGDFYRTSDKIYVCVEDTDPNGLKYLASEAKWVCVQKNGMTINPTSEVTYARIGEYYTNTDLNVLYKCTKSGYAYDAEWELVFTTTNTLRNAVQPMSIADRYTINTIYNPQEGDVCLELTLHKVYEYTSYLDKDGNKLYSWEYKGSHYIYRIPYSVIINQAPLYSTFYLTYVNESPFVHFDYVNQVSPAQFVGTTFTWKRDFIGDYANIYTLEMEITQSIAKDLGLYVRDEKTKKITDFNVRMIAVFYNNAGSPYRWAELEKEGYDEETFSYRFKAIFHALDHFDRFNYIRVDDMHYIGQTESGTDSYFKPNVGLKLYVLAPTSTDIYTASKTTLHDLDTIVPNLKDDKNIKWQVCNVFEAEQGIDFYYSYADIMNSAVSPVAVDNTDGINGITTDYVLDSVPVFEYNYASNDTLINEGMDALNDKRIYIEDALVKMENSFGMDFKFFNTFGPAKTYYLLPDDNENLSIDDDAKIYLDRTNLTLNFRIKLVSNSDTYTSKLIARDIKAYIEDFDDLLSNLHIPTIITQIMTTYRESITYIEFLGFNNYGPGIQHIFRDKNDDIPIHIPPEMLCVNCYQDTDGKIVPDINIITSIN